MLFYNDYFDLVATLRKLDRYAHSVQVGYADFGAIFAQQPAPDRLC